MLQELSAFVDAPGISPVVDSIYPVDRIQEALRHLELGKHFGKIVVTMPEVMDSSEVRHDLPRL
jgi:NADPH:quinone reductase-like Zn-dependent oxidoreductase